MNRLNNVIAALAAGIFALTALSCSDDKSYADLLKAENRAVNAYLADQRVVNEVPADTVFEYGENAPYYRLDEDGMLYMQVIDPGTPGNRVKYNEQIYFRFTRYNLNYYEDGVLKVYEGNDDVLNGNLSFRYQNYQISSSYNFGAGIQAPLEYLPVDCVVNIIVKSQYGMPSEMSYVTPHLYNIRYFRPKY